jgi:hypothetical protein
MNYSDPVALAAFRRRRTTARVGQDLPWWDEPLLQFIGPDTARQRVNEVDGLFAVLDLEITGSTTVSQRFKSLWAQQYQSWKEFKKSVDEMGTASMLFQALSVNERAGHFARGLKEWREAFTREGGKATSAAPKEERKETSTGIPWATVTVLIAGAAGLVAVGYAVRGFYSPPASPQSA